jgi:hypothetical protein
MKFLKSPLKSPFFPSKEPTMSDDRRKILEMLATGRITPEETERLLDALGGPSASRPAQAPSGAGPKFLRVQVEKGRGDERDPKHVNIRVPLQLLRAGVKLQGIMPTKARAGLSAALAEKGIDVDLDKLKAEGLEAFIDSLTHTTIDVESDDGRSRVKVGCE